MTSMRALPAHPARLIAVAALVAPLIGAAPPPPLGPLAERVVFASADGGHTGLFGYVFKPEVAHAARVPAIVMMHGRAGAYSSLANGKYDASTLSQRHQKWGHLWAQQGYLALLVDGFGPRGFPNGFTHQSYSQRPESVNEVTVRPLDAYGALAYLRTRSNRAAGMVERRQRYARHDVVLHAGAQIADAGHRLPRRAGVLSRMRAEGTIREGPCALRPGAGARRYGR
jgi:hypothetical protein